MSTRWKIVLAIVVVIVIAVMVFINIKKSRGDVVEVSVTDVELGNITKIVSGSGYVQPEVDVEIAARISAEIIELHVDEGDEVKKGQLLVELDRQLYEARVEEAQSGVMSGRASLKKAEADFRRAKDLFDQNLTSQADLDAAEANMLLAQSQLDRASAALRQTNDDLAKTRLHSPIAGTVTKLNKEEGEMAVGSSFQADPIMTVSDLSRMEVLSEIDENDVVLLSIGDSTKIEVDAIPDTVFNGVVSEIAHTATTRGFGTQEQVTNFEVKIAVTTAVEKLRPGMSSTVDISTETHDNTLFVPIQCVTMRQVSADSTKTKNDETAEDATSEKSDKVRKEVVFMVEDGVATVVPVETGISDDTNIEITSGLSEGQKVVSGSYKAISRDLKDGSNVKVKEGGRSDENND